MQQHQSRLWMHRRIHEQDEHWNLYMSDPSMPTNTHTLSSTKDCTQSSHGLLNISGSGSSQSKAVVLDSE